MSYLGKVSVKTATAADIGTGAVTSTGILDGTIATADIADDAITSAKIADGTIVNADINASAAIAASKTTGLLPLAGGTMTGEINAADQLITRPVLKDYGETKVAMAAHAVDLSLGNVQTYTLSGNQTLTFTNPPASGTSGSFTLLVTNGGSATLTWPTSVDWAGGTAPTLTASGIDAIVFTTIDGGTIWYGFAAGLDLS